MKTLPTDYPRLIPAFAVRDGAKAIAAPGCATRSATAQKVAHTTYRGPYEGLPGAWGEFNDWMEANGLTQAEDLWEHYVTGPQASLDSAVWRTELYRPLL